MVFCGRYIWVAMGSITRACAAMGCAADKLQRSAVTDGVAAELSVMRKEGIHFAEAHRRQVHDRCGNSTGGGWRS